MADEQTDEMKKLKMLLIYYGRYWKVFLLSTVILVGIASTYICLSKPIYQITANILVEEKENNPMAQMMQSMAKGFSLTDILGGSVSIHDEMELLRSFSMFRRVVKTLHLNETYKSNAFLRPLTYYNNSPVRIIPVGNIADTLACSLNFKIQGNVNKASIKVKKGFRTLGSIETPLPTMLQTSYGCFKIDTTSFYIPEENFNVKVVFRGYDHAAELLQEKVTIDLITKKANIISLQIEETNIRKGKDILNTLIMAYNITSKERKNVLASNMDSFLSERINLISEELVEIEKEIEKYKKSNSLTDIEAEAKIILEKSSDFKERLIEAETQYTVIELVEEFLLKPENRFSLVPLNIGLNDRTVLEGLQKYNEALLERLRLLKTTQGNTPTVDIMNAQIDAMHDNMLATIRSIKSGFNHAKNNLKNQEDYFIGRIKGMPTQEREFINIKRQQMIKQELFVFLLQKKEENALSMAVTTPKAEIMDSAYNLNEPISPKPLQTIVLAIGLAIIVGGLYVKAKYQQ